MTPPLLHCELNDLGSAYDCTPTSDGWWLLIVVVTIVVVGSLLAPVMWRWAGYWWHLHHPERDKWIRAFNRLETAVRRHVEAKQGAGFGDEADAALEAAHRAVMRDVGPKS